MQIIPCLLLAIIPLMNSERATDVQNDVSCVEEMTVGIKFSFTAHIKSQTGFLGLYESYEVVAYHGILRENSGTLLTFSNVEKFTSTGINSQFESLPIVGDYLHWHSHELEKAPEDLTIKFDDTLFVRSGIAPWHGPRIGIDFEFNEEDGETVSAVVAE